jgi:hypothetical protein
VRTHITTGWRCHLLVVTGRDYNASEQEGESHELHGGFAVPFLVYKTSFETRLIDSHLETALMAIYTEATIGECMNFLRNKHNKTLQKSNVDVLFNIIRLALQTRWTYSRKMNQWSQHVEYYLEAF